MIHLLIKDVIANDSERSEPEPQSEGTRSSHARVAPMNTRDARAPYKYPHSNPFISTCI